MPLSDFRDNPSWQEAVALAPKLVQLAEQLPASEEMGLNFHLRKVMVKLPASIATDLADGSSHRHIYLHQLAAILDIIDKVYPALDTADCHIALGQLMEQVADKLPSKPAVVSAPEPAAISASAPTPPAPEEAPANVPVVPEPPAPEPPAPPHTVSVAVQPADAVPPAENPPESHVQPDSVQ